MLTKTAVYDKVSTITHTQEQMSLKYSTMLCDRIKTTTQKGQFDLVDSNFWVLLIYDMIEYQNYMNRVRKEQMMDMQRLFIDVAKDTYAQKKPYYVYRDMPFVPFNKNRDICRAVYSISDSIVNEYDKMFNNPSLVLKRTYNNNVPISLSDAYKQLASKYAMTYGLDTPQARKQLIYDLVQGGVRVPYDSRRGSTQRMDKALNTLLLNGIRDVNKAVETACGEQYQANGVELSAHAFSALDHIDVQGKRFHVSEFDNMQNGLPFTDEQGNQYEGFERPIGMWNCRHYEKSVILGVGKPEYTEEQLLNIRNNNVNGVTFDSGIQWTLYHCVQYQRNLINKVRELKQSQILAKTLGDDGLAMYYQAKINEAEGELIEFSRKCKLNFTDDTIDVSGYKKVKIIL